MIIVTAKEPRKLISEEQIVISMSKKRAERIQTDLVLRYADTIKQADSLSVFSVDQNG